MHIKKAECLLALRFFRSRYKIAFVLVYVQSMKKGRPVGRPLSLYQASLLSLSVMALFLLAALFLWIRPALLALSTFLTATL